MWWGIQRDAQNYDYMALGNHGQFIYISPQKNLIILRFGETYGEIRGADGWVDMFHEFATNLIETPLGKHEAFSSSKLDQACVDGEPNNSSGSTFTPSVVRCGDEPTKRQGFLPAIGLHSLNIMG